MSAYFRLQYCEKQHSRIQLSVKSNKFQKGDRVIIYPFLITTEKHCKTRKAKVLSVDGELFITLDIEMTTIEKGIKKQIGWGLITK